MSVVMVRPFWCQATMNRLLLELRLAIPAPDSHIPEARFQFVVLPIIPEIHNEDVICVEWCFEQPFLRELRDRLIHVETHDYVALFGNLLDITLDKILLDAPLVRSPLATIASVFKAVLFDQIYLFLVAVIAENDHFITQTFELVQCVSHVAAGFSGAADAVPYHLHALFFEWFIKISVV